MTIRGPQYDLPIGVSGASDLWDDGLAGEILSADYFSVPSPPVQVGSHLKAWTGSSWALGELKRWGGSSWEGATLQRWNGSTWVPVP